MFGLVLARMSWMSGTLQVVAGSVLLEGWSACRLSGSLKIGSTAAAAAAVVWYWRTRVARDRE